MKRIHIKEIVLLVLIALTGFSSCQVMTKISDSGNRDLFRDMESTDTTTIANIPWHEYFADSFLQSYIEEGLNNNQDMLIATERIKQAEANLGMAKAAFFPDASLSGQIQHDKISNGTNGKDVLGYHSTSYTLGVSVSWEADIWGKLSHQKKSKYADMLNSYEGRSLIRTSLISNIANAYYSLLALDKQLRITEEMAALMEENLDVTKALREAGKTNGAAVEQTKASLHSVKVTIPDLENNIRQLENSMCVMLGREPGEITRGSIDNQITPAQLAFGVPAQMLAKRPDVQAAELSFRSAFELTHAAKASFYPSINLTSGTIGYANNSLSNFFRPENIFASIAGGLTQPIFARKQLITQYKIAKYEQQAALLTFEKTVLEAGQEVSDIMSTYESSLKKSQDRNTQVASLDLAVMYTQELFKAGEANYLEVLSAQQGLLEAELNMVSDKLEQLQATSNLYRALGGGIE
ncbi:MAG: efflux transporter outer membrane subunit [Mangrovibacterium sp.]